MNTAKDLEKAVVSLPSSELKEFRAWFTEFDSKKWDIQIKSDIESDSLNKLGAKALKRHLAKETTEM